LSSETRRFQLAPGVTAKDVAEIVGATGRPKVTSAIQRTWFDTFDQRLRQKGWQLCRTGSGRASRLILDGGDGVHVASSNGDDADLVSTDHLPLPLQDRISSVVEERVLLPLVEVHSRETVLPVLDGLAKTVARVTVESRRALRPRRVVLPPVVTVARPGG
jgi:hypothetical protein